MRTSFSSLRFWTTAVLLMAAAAGAAPMTSKVKTDRTVTGETTVQASPREVYLLRAVVGRLIAFQWITFAGDATLGRNAPPIAPPALRNERPLPTWVEVRFELRPDGRTHVTLHHSGFRHGDLWDRFYAFFERAWRGVLRSPRG